MTRTRSLTLAIAVLLTDICWSAARTAALPGDNNLVVTVEVSPASPSAGEQVEIRVRMQDPDPGTVVSRITIESGDGRKFRVYFTNLACTEVLNAGGLDETYVLPHTYKTAGTYVARSEVVAYQRLCFAHLDDSETGTGSTSVTVT